MEIRELISLFSDTPADEIRIGLDGCGVPVYAVPLAGIARSFLRLVCPDLIRDPSVRTAAERNLACLTRYPEMLDGKDQTCATFFSTGDLLSKAGALAMYPVGIRSRRIGMAVRIMDGNDDRASFAALNAVRQLGVPMDPAFSKRLDRVHPSVILNDNRVPAGHLECVFKI